MGKKDKRPPRGKNTIIDGNLVSTQQFFLNEEDRHRAHLTPDQGSFLAEEGNNAGAQRKSRSHLQLILLGGAAVLGLGVGGLFVLSGNSEVATTAVVPVAPVVKLINPDKLRAEEGAQLDEAKSIADKFINSTDLTTRAAMIHDPDRVIPLMLGYYGEHELEHYDFQEYRDVHVKQHPDRVKEYRIAGITADTFESVVFTFYWSPSVGIKLDWEFFVGYNPMSWEEFQASEKEIVSNFRVVANPTDYHNFEFSSAEQWYSLALSAADGSPVTFGYVQRGTVANKRSGLEIDFRSVFRGRRNVPMILTLRRTKACHADQAIVDDIVKIGWEAINSETKWRLKQ